jgi:hypothetical protein
VLARVAAIAVSYGLDIGLAFPPERLLPHTPRIPSTRMGHHASQTICKTFQGRTQMRAVIVAVTALATVSIAGDAFAQRSAREMMDDMKAKYPRSFGACQSLASSRGYRLSDGEYEAKAVMMFIEGCIMGRQR